MSELPTITTSSFHGLIGVSRVDVTPPVGIYARSWGAAKHDVAGQYVSALYIAGSQLLVVSAKYSIPSRMDYLLGQKAYQEIYQDLNSAAEQQSKVFVMDLGANGLRFKQEKNELDTADVSGKSVVFDGDWGRARISEAESRKTVEATDAQYTQMLQALIAALKKPSEQAHTRQRDEAQKGQPFGAALFAYGRGDANDPAQNGTALPCASVTDSAVAHLRHSTARGLQTLARDRRGCPCTLPGCRSAASRDRWWCGCRRSGIRR